MILTRRAALVGTAAVATSAALAACGGNNADGLESTTLHLGNGAEPLSLDPHIASGTWENRIIGDMLIGLTTEDAQARPIPGMATEWTTSDDGLVWTFKLRDAVWSDGVAVTADDFVFAFQRLFTMQPSAKYASLQYVIKNAQRIHTSAGTANAVPASELGVKAIDPKTVEFTLEHPAPYLPGLFTHYTAFPVPKHAVEAHGKDWVEPGKYLANGPYVLEQWKLNDFVHVKKNDRYWDAASVCLSQVFFYPTSDDTSAERQMRSGELDVQTNFSGSRLEEINRNLPGYARVHTYLGLTYYLFNMRNEKFQDKRVRQALNMALDREFITNDILKGGQQPAYSLVPPGIADFQSGTSRLGWSEVPRAERLVQAKALLEEAGYGPDKPLKFSLAHRNSGDNPRIVPVVQGNWRDIAPWVEPELIGADTQLNYEKLRTGDFEVGDAGWIADFNDAKNFIYLFETRTGQMNYGQYSNPEYDRLAAAADVEADAATRVRLMKQAEKVLLDDEGVMPVFFLTNRNLVSPRVSGWVDNATDIHRLRYLCLEGAAAAGGTEKK